MKKFLLSAFLVLVGSGTWWVVARTAGVSVRKWDAKFDTVLRSNLTRMGVNDHDMISSVHQVRKDKEGEWVVHKMTIRMPETNKQRDLLSMLEKSGADLVRDRSSDESKILVKRGSRVYQEITFAHP